ncbi:MAG: hypothetical protein COA38_05710 [Fluviicola sp.]|nr:MAG: hypothetical protein COA38_05710 [Fluviicola sp.]
MKKIIFLIAFAPTLLFAEVDLKSEIQIYRTSSKIDNKLKGNDAVYEFQFQPDSRTITPANVNIYYAIDGVNKRQVTKKGIITVPTTAGQHIFQFFYNDQFLEVYSDSLLIEARHRDKYTIKLITASAPNVALKPVIYLYPQLTTDVRVQLDIHGEDAFLYPSYVDSWNFTAEPNGDLIFDDETYNYLFWEATNRRVLSPKQTASGFFVESENVIEFLEEKLSTAGFNSKEQADFITFWGPRLAKNKLTFIHFEFNEACEKYADLDITPKPDNLYRMFMVWGAVSEVFEVREQEIKRFDRSGFSVLEWGGQESHIRQSFVNKSTREHQDF